LECAALVIDECGADAADRGRHLIRGVSLASEFKQNP
jgi:hypothetical protein